tara:strand:+ start:186 stop:425 length:240 start_codon:yes stop_codon:yes gene_type:complete
MSKEEVFKDIYRAIRDAIGNQFNYIALDEDEIIIKTKDKNEWRLSISGLYSENEPDEPTPKKSKKKKWWSFLNVLTLTR